jgi:hypothetical protein
MTALEQNAHADLRAWYLAGLWPKLAAAADSGEIEPGLADELDDVMRDMLDLVHETYGEAA